MTRERVEGSTSLFDVDSCFMELVSWDCERIYYVVWSKKFTPESRTILGRHYYQVPYPINDDNTAVDQ
jgi:hypothetical protein